MSWRQRPRVSPPTPGCNARARSFHCLLWAAKCYVGSMLARIAAITFILGCTSVAWFILGGTIGRRTDESDDKARPGVVSIWGAAQEQSPPSASYE